MGEPLVSVIIPTYGRSAYLDAAVSSTLAQSWRHLECIVVDDCSPEPVTTMDDPRVRIIRHVRNMGAAGARNTGIAHATGEFVVFLDDDDWLHPDRLSWAMDQIGDARTHACETVLVWGPDDHRPRGFRYEGDQRSLFDRLPPPHLGQVVLRREDVVQMHPRLRTGQDVEWWMRMGHAADFAWSDEVGHFWRMHAGDRHARESMVPARRAIVDLRWADADRTARDRMARRLSVAYINAGRRWPATWWAVRAFALRPSVSAVKLAAKALRPRPVPSMERPDA